MGIISKRYSYIFYSVGGGTFLYYSFKESVLFEEFKDAW